jgi:hypothetical protein
MLALFAAAAVLGWTALPADDRRRRTWRVVGIAAALWLLLGVAADAERVHNKSAFFDARNAQRDELRAVLDDPAAIAAARGCEVLAGAPFDRPLMILWTDSSPARVRAWPDAQVSSTLLFASEAPQRLAWRVIARQGRATARASGC